jgi:hypothetical protein
MHDELAARHRAITLRLAGRTVKARPADAPKSLKPFEVLQDGTSKGWVLARGYDNALSVVARLEGFTVSTGKATAPVTKETIAAKLAEFTDDELLALGLSRKPQKGAKK